MAQPQLTLHGCRIIPLVVAALCVGPGGISAQQDCGGCITPVSRNVALASPLTPLASLVIPGTGQVLAGKNRGVVYLLTEAVFLAWHLRNSDVGQRERTRYRSLAFAVARGGYMPTVRDTTFEYFEQMGKYIASGPFDLDPGPELVPPSDESTFNGSIWALARRTFFVDAENPPPRDSDAFVAALAFYENRAVGPNFRWSWEGDVVAMQAFTDAIKASDDAFQRGSLALAIVFANHLASAIDAHITNRLSTNAVRAAFRSTVSADHLAIGSLRIVGGLWISF